MLSITNVTAATLSVNVYNVFQRLRTRTSTELRFLRDTLHRTLTLFVQEPNRQSASVTFPVLSHLMATLCGKPNDWLIVNRRGF
jgi:hypothetical protein